MRLVLPLLVLLATHQAQAYCRTTTCNPSSENCNPDANGCAQSGTKLAWPTRCVQLNMNRRGTANLGFSETKDALDRVLVRWSNVKCANGKEPSIKMALGQDVDVTNVEYNASGRNVNLIVFSDDS